MRTITTLLFCATVAIADQVGQMAELRVQMRDGTTIHLTNITVRADRVTGFDVRTDRQRDLVPGAMAQGEWSSITNGLAWKRRWNREMPSLPEPLRSALVPRDVNRARSTNPIAAAREPRGKQMTVRGMVIRIEAGLHPDEAYVTICDHGAGSSSTTLRCRIEPQSIDHAAGLKWGDELFLKGTHLGRQEESRDYDMDHCSILKSFPYSDFPPLM